MAHNHFRSISLPSTFHLISSQFDEQLIKLISSDTTTSCSSIRHSLSSLIGLYDCVDELLIRPSNRNIHGKSVDGILEGSLKLLEVCDVARDALLSTKECLQGVQSLLRRSSGGSAVKKGVYEYIDCRKKIKRRIRICLKNVKKTNRGFDRNSCVFRQVEIITSNVLMSLLGGIAGVKSQSSERNLVVRLVRRFSDVDYKSMMNGSEFEDVDDQLIRLFMCLKKSGINMAQVEKTRIRMGNLEGEIEYVVEELERLFRRLVKIRVTLLNLVSNY